LEHESAQLVNRVVERQSASSLQRAAAFVEEAWRWLSGQTPDVAQDGVPGPVEALGLDVTHRVAGNIELTARPQVLLVEDNLDLRETLSKLLGSHYRVTAVSDGQAALALLQATEDLPDLVLTDVMMPRMDGIELLTRMRATAADPAPPSSMTAAPTTAPNDARPSYSKLTNRTRSSTTPRTAIPAATVFLPGCPRKWSLDSAYAGHRTNPMSPVDVRQAVLVPRDCRAACANAHFGHWRLWIQTRNTGPGCRMSCNCRFAP
jgi:CheY-like chemotaxis protein